MTDNDLVKSTHFCPYLYYLDSMSDEKKKRMGV